MGLGMDLRKRLVFSILLALLLAITGASAITTYTMQQQSQQQTLLNQQQGLVGASNIAVNGIIADELSRIQVAAKSLAINPDVMSALRYRSPGTVQDNLLEPYRVSSRLTFISLITTEPLSQIAQAKVLSPPELSSIVLVTESLRLQQDRSGIWDGPTKPSGAPVPQAPYAVAVSPVLAGPGPTLVGVVVVGRILDNTYVTQQLTNNLGDFQAAIVNNSLVLAIPTELDRAFTAADAHRPYQPQIQAAARTVPLPNGSWHSATWQIGPARYVVVTRPLGYGSKDQLAIALAAAAPFGGAHLFLTPVSLWLAGRLGITPATAFSVVTRGLWWLAMILLFAVIGSLISIAIHRIFRPITRLTERVETFLQHQTWTPIPTAPGELGRLGDAVAALAGEASHWSTELTVYRDRLQSVLDSMGTGVVVSDSDGRVELINPAARELLGFDPGAALAVPVTRPISNGQAFQATNGRIINAVSTPIRRRDGKTLGLVTVLEDLTRERELERVRSDFLTVVSHELRTPLTAVKGSLDLLLDGDTGTLEPLQQRFLQTARRNAERLISLVQDLLDLSRLEAGQVNLTLQPADIRRILDDVVIGLGTIFDRKHQQIHLELPAQPVLVMADRRRFEQVVTNLLGNASNYTPEEGQIEIQAQPDLAAGQAVLTVRNSGPGIAPEDREHLFEKFYRGGNALTRQDGGSGLGLAIVKSLVDLHHGTITVESEPGNGAAFIVRLPLAGDERANTGR
jgi:signal transduction histidine kinase